LQRLHRRRERGVRAHDDHLRIDVLFRQLAREQKAASVRQVLVHDQKVRLRLRELRPCIAERDRRGHDEAHAFEHLDHHRAHDFLVLDDEGPQSRSDLLRHLDK